MKPIEYFNRFLNVALSDPRRIPTIINREVVYAAQTINRQYFRNFRQPDGYDLMAADWDTAIILDACRYDFFMNRNTLRIGNLRKEISPGSESREFMQHTFKNRTLHDTVYVTGNPYTTILDENTFHNVYLDENWDREDMVARPDWITKNAVEAHDIHPQKRIIVHYMQPHFPILHPEYAYVNDLLEFHRGRYIAAETTLSELREAYAANLEYVLRFVEQLVDSIMGKVVVTADHGELLGERQFPIPVRGTDHFPELYLPELVDVPWLTISGSSRRKISEDPPVGRIEIDEETKEDRLEALGYL
jgi:hypothetical protein